MQGDFHLGDWVVQPEQCRLSKDGRTVQVRAKVMDLLAYLAERPGQVVSKERLLDDVWGSQAVTESALTRTVTELRQALGDNADEPQLLETIPKRGYRLIGPVVPVQGTNSLDAAVPTQRPKANRKVALTAAALALLIGLASWAWVAGIPRHSSVRVAVLPFDHIGEDQQHQYLADGLAEDTTVSLGMIDPERLIVIDPASTRRYRNASKSLTEIGNELNADYLVESTVRTEGRRLRLTSKLIRVTDQALIWSQSYERELTSVLGLQLEVSAAIAEQVRVRVSSESRVSIERRHTRNAEAYDLYMRARTLWSQRKPLTTQRAVEYYNRAIALDHEYALAWSGIADARALSPITGDADPFVMQPLARQAANEAVRADPNLAEAQTSQGILNFWLEWNWPVAERALRRAIALNPSYPLAHNALGNVLSHSGRHRDAQEEIRRARELDPLDPMMHAVSSQFAFNAHDYSGAADHARRAIRADPEFWVGHMELGQALEEMGKVDLAVESLVTAERFSGGNSKAISTRGYVLGKAGRTSEARVVLEELVTRARERYVPMYAIALVRAGLGDREGVFEALDAAYAARDVHLVFLPVDPKWDEYRTDLRFTALLERCGFIQHPD